MYLQINRNINISIIKTKVMRNPAPNYIWKKAPFLRLLIPVILGIAGEFYLKLPLYGIIVSAIITIIFFITFSVLPEAVRFRFKAIQGLLIAVALLLFGSFLAWQKDIRNHSNWYGNFIEQKDFIVATIDEPLQEKAKSYKVIATADLIISKGKEEKTAGKFLIYFKKDSASENLKYGDQVIVNKLLSPIRNSGNPAGFDYKQYCAFRQIYHQAYLKENEWVLLAPKNRNIFRAFIFSTREKVVSILQKYLGENDESAIAKALLIGYKVDLDKDLVQAYSNAGVVHIIAISGLHIGIIYAILLWVFSALPLTKKSRPLRLFLIIICLWGFAFLTGAAPSVIRAAIMFSFIIAGNALNKKSSVYNSLAASAFFILCVNPYELWNVGFQLSYLAVLGIVIAQKSVCNWFYFKNKWLQKLWQLAAVSLSAQLFTFPLCLYYFHQLPLLFLLANLLAIPLASLILCGCLILIIISPITFVAFYFAKLLYATIWFLNHCVLFFDSIPFSLWKNVSVSVIDTFLLYLIVLAFIYSFLKKNKAAFKFALAVSCLFFSFKTVKKWDLNHQKKIIVYNIPMHKAVEFIDGKNFYFTGDSVVVQDKLLTKYNVTPAHTAFELQENSRSLNELCIKNNFFQFYNKRIIMIDSAIIYYAATNKIKASYIIISKNPRIKIADIAQNFECNNFIFDASNPPWKIEQWKKECEELHLHFYSVPERGAFVINL